MRVKNPLPDFRTSHGLIAGCSYAVSASPHQKLRSINFNVQIYNDPKAAAETYNRLINSKGNSKGKVISGVTDRAFLLDDSNQVISLKGSTITTLTISKLDPDSHIDESIFKKLISL